MAVKKSGKLRNQQVSEGQINNLLTYQQVALGAGATSLPSIPANANLALIQVEVQNMRWIDDGATVPTAAIGQLLQAGSSIWYNGELSKFSMIRVAAGAIVNISYYESP